MNDESVNVDEAAVIDELCAYQAQLDRGVDEQSVESLSSTSPASSKLVVGYQRCLDFLNAVGRRSSGKNPGHVVSRYAVPPTIARFVVTGPPFVGGFGLVFPGTDPTTGRSIAIKVPKPELLASAELIERFINEARAVTKLEHPNIVKILECSWHGITPYIVMPFINGPNLAAWRKTRAIER